jgi:acetylglutamate kinase
MIPVVAPIGRGEDEQSYNVNADTAAGEIAAALHAEKLVFLTDVTGILRDAQDASSLISTLHVRDVEGLIEGKIISGGMIPKVEACVKAVKSGVRKTHVIDGRIPHSMLLEIFTREGIGTEIVQ